MTYDQELLDQLEGLLGWKKSKKFYAEKLEITEEQVEELLKELRSRDKEQDEGKQFLYKVNKR